MADSHHDPDGFTFDTGAHFITNRLAAATGVADAVPRRRALRRDGLARRPQLRLPDRPAAGPALRPVGDRRTSAGATPTAPVTGGRLVPARRTARALADEIALPLVEAWSGAPADELSPAVADKIPSSIAETVGLKLAARLTHRAVAIGYCREAPQSANVWHVYPERGSRPCASASRRDVADSVRLQQPGRAHHRERRPRRRRPRRRTAGPRSGGHQHRADQRAPAPRRGHRRARTASRGSASARWSS